MRPGRSSDFVGRTEELAALEDALDASADEVVVVLIEGDAGSGKTALAREFSDQVEARGVPVHWGRCVELGGAPALWPWSQALRSIGDEAIEAGQRALEGRAEEPFAASDAMAEVLRLHSDQARVIILDDLHRADLPSLEVLRFLTSRAHQIPLLIVGTHRSHELRSDPHREAILSGVANLGRRLLASPLGLDDVRTLLASAGTAVPADGVGSPDDAQEVLARSGGNALYVEQLVLAVERSGLEGLAELPGGVASAVRARLLPLAAPTRTLLAHAAVLGASVEPSLLGQVAGVSPLDLSSLIAPAVAAGLVTSAKGEVTFTHLLVREVLSDELVPHARAKTHLAAAEALAASNRPVPPAVVAQHLLDAGDLADSREVARWSEEAATAARRLGGHRDAGQWSEMAVQAWARIAEVEGQARSLISAINDRATVGDGPAAVALSSELTELGRRASSGRLLARAAMARTELFEPSSDLDGPPLLREALAHPDVIEDPALQADLWWGLATLLGAPSVDGPRRDAGGAREAIAKLEDLAAAGGHAAATRLPAARLEVDSGPLLRRERDEWFSQAFSGPPGIGVMDRIYRAYWATSLAFERGDLATVDRELRDWEVLADRSDSSFWRWRAAMARASHSYATGSFRRAERMAVERSSLVVNLHPDMAIRVAGGMVFAIRRDQGRIAEVAKGLGPARLGVLSVLVSIDRGDIALARRELAGVVAAVESTGPDDLNWLCAMSIVAAAADALEDRERARWAADQLEPFASQMVMWGRSYVFGMPVAEALGIARRGAEQPQESAEAFRLARDWADRAGAPGFGARARIGLASVLIDGDAERARSIEEAVDVATGLGMVPVLEQAAFLLGQVRRTARGPAAVEPAVAVSSHDVPMRALVRALDRFEVVGAGAGEPARWSSRKARDTLKMLICRRGRSVPREELIDLLWPGTDLATGRTRLSVVLSMLRSALDPDRRLPSDPLRADRESIALDLDLVSVDVEDLLTAASSALAAERSGDPLARAQLARAVGLAGGGELLPEDPYADFAQGLRLTIRRTHRDLLWALARTARGDGRAMEAESWLGQLIELDPDDEATFDAVVTSLEVDGRTAEANAHRVRRLERQAALGLD